MTPATHGEPTDKIVRAIVRGIDGRSTFLLPSWRAWAVVTLAHWLPAAFRLDHDAIGTQLVQDSPLHGRDRSATSSASSMTSPAGLRVGRSAL